MTVLLSAGLWKGLGPRIIMIGTLTALQWFIYDSVKVFFRLPRPPPPEEPESLKKKRLLKQQQAAWANHLCLLYYWTCVNTNNIPGLHTCI